MSLKRITLICLLTMTAIEQVQACDICGCGAGSYYIGILPEFNSKIFGIRYRNSAIATHLAPDGKHTYLTTREQYQNVELWGGWTIKEKFRLLAYLPLGINTKQNEQNGLESKAGLSDVSAQGFYRLFRSKRTVGSATNAKLLVQDLWIGGGVKAPTGKYNPSDKSWNSVSVNMFQLGTGSWDFMLTGMYDIRLQDMGANVNMSYKLNTTNAYDYYYGNRFSSSFQLYHKFRFHDVFMIAPNAGFQFEQSQKDWDANTSIRATGGVASYGTFGIELQFKQITLGGNWQPVLSQNLGMGAVKTHNKTMLHLSLLL